MADHLSCRTCRYFIPKGIGRFFPEDGTATIFAGHCHRYPMVSSVKSDHWCGEHLEPADRGVVVEFPKPQRRRWLKRT